MEKKVIFELKSLYRDNLRVTGYQFGTGEESVCIVGAIRGNEVQQLFSCSQLIKRLAELENRGCIKKGKSIMVIPAINSYSLNIAKRFWPTDNTDINRMFPGYNLGETTQRIAAGVFEKIKDYKYGIQFASFYMPGEFTPHVRMMETGYGNVKMAQKFGLPFVVVRKPRPYDTTTLNYNWQLWNSNAFSVYTHETDHIDKKSAELAVNAVLRFMENEKILKYHVVGGYLSEIIKEENLRPVRTAKPGIFDPKVKVEDEVSQGEVLAEILDPYDGSVREEITAPAEGTVFFAHNHPLTYNNTVVYKIIEKM